MGLFLSLEGAVDYSEWTSLPIHDRAKLRATIYLRNMAEVLDRHTKEMEDERKKLLDGRKVPLEAGRGGHRPKKN